MKNLFTICLVVLSAGSAFGNMGPVTSTPAGWVTVRSLSGGGCAPGDMLTATFSDGTVANAYANANGNWFMPVPAGVPTPATATVTCSNGASVGNITVTSAPMLNPPSTYARANHTILEGSSLTLASGEAVDLAGNYSVIADAVDYTSGSAGYGNLSGFVSASGFNVYGTSSLGALSLSLDTNALYQVSMLPVWNGGDSTTFSFDISGTIQIGSLSTPVTGIVTGTSVYESDNWETYFATFSLDTTSFGTITGDIISTGQAQLIPEPVTMALVLQGLGGFVLIRKCKVL